MGIYIKGMEMPKTWRDCVFSNGAAQCKLDNMELCGLCYRQRCPLVSVPPHGDLIDRREAIIDANERAYDFWLSDDEVNATIQFLNEQTAIIPADSNAAADDVIERSLEEIRP